MSIDWRNERVVVTGGSAFTGSFIVEKLLSLGASVVVVRHRSAGFLAENSGVHWMEGDLSDSAFCERLLEGTSRLLHFASVRKNVSFHRDHASEVTTGNVSLSLGLVEAVRRHPVPVTFCSSASVVGMPDSSSRFSDGYVLGKFLCERLWELTSRQCGFPLLILRPVAVYGPRDTFSAEGNVIPSLMLKAANASKELEVWGSGNVRRSFLYVEDLVEALVVLLEQGAAGVQYLTPRETVTIKRLAEHIRDLASPGLRITFDASKPEGSSMADLPPPPPCLESFVWTRLDEGLRRTLDWHKASR